MAEYASDGGRLFSAMDACRGMRSRRYHPFSFPEQEAQTEKNKKNRAENGFCYGEAKGKARS